MKIGSIVECVKQLPTAWNQESMPIVGRKYTIREVYVPMDRNEVYLRFEEIINPKMMYIEGFYEVCFRNIFFREIEFPPALQEEINECLTREIELV